MTLLLGLDLGTSSAKAILFNPDTRQIEASAAQEYPVDKPALDQDGRPVHPAIIWADQRSIVECRVLSATVGEKEYANVTGTLPAVGFLGPTLLWLAKNAPELLERTCNVVLPKDYLRLKMTGYVATDLSDAAGTGIFNIRQADWAWDILSRLQMPLEILPSVLSSTTVAGELRPEAAAELGFWQAFQ